MPISLTCACGARLEIDDKFAGQSIPCPDCNKPLLAEPPAPPPTRTSGLAILSLILALVGAFTVVGTLAAIACGAAAYRQVTRKRSTVGGAYIAQAGMVLGVLFSVMAIGAYASPFLFGIDSLYRQYVWAGKLDYSGPLTITPKRIRGDDAYTLDRPSLRWGMLQTPSQKDSDHFMLVNPRDDAYIMVLSDRIDRDDDEGSIRSRALNCFRGSDFVRLIGRLPENASEGFRERGIDDGGFFLDIPLGGIPRTFWFRLEKRGDLYVKILVCGARTHRFAHFKDAFQQVFLKQE